MILSHWNNFIGYFNMWQIKQKVYNFKDWEGEGQRKKGKFRYSYQFKSMLILRASGKGIVAEGYIRMLES